MKASELRIGNIVYQGAMYGIDAVTAYQIYNLELLNKKVLVSDYYISFSPINLSEDWLLKFGFKKARTFDELNRWFIGINPVTKDWLFDIVWLDNAEFPFYRNGHHQIRYVHQLQNLFFALTGTELEIKK